MRSPVQSRVPLLDKNKAFGRLPLLGAFFFLSLREIIVKSAQSETLGDCVKILIFAS